MNHCLMCEHLTVYYHKEAALLDLCLQIPMGRKVAIIGPNGAGKTTLLKTLIGLIKPLSGRSLLLNEPYEKVKTKIAYVPQKESVDWDFPITVLEVVIMGRFHQLGLFKWVRKADEQAALEALKLLGIAELADKKLSELSGGQQQRVFIARALVQEAQIYLLDEPFTGVDAATEAILKELFEKLKQMGKTLIVVHHDLDTVDEIFDDVVLLNHRLIAYGNVKEVFTPENIAKTYGRKEEIFAKVIVELSKKTSGIKA